jgi:replicative DNA helicase
VTDQANNRIPPQNLEAEQMVLGAVLIDNDALLRISDMLRAEDFYKDAHRKIFATMMGMFHRREAIDLVTLMDAVKLNGGLIEVGGASYLATLVSLVPTAANIRYHAKIVQEKALLRRILYWSSTVERKAH